MTLIIDKNEKGIPTVFFESGTEKFPLIEGENPETTFTLLTDEYVLKSWIDRRGDFEKYKQTVYNLETLSANWKGARTPWTRWYHRTFPEAFLKGSPDFALGAVETDTLIALFACYKQAGEIASTYTDSVPPAVIFNVRLRYKGENKTQFEASLPSTDDFYHRRQKLNFHAAETVFDAQDGYTRISHEYFGCDLLSTAAKLVVIDKETQVERVGNFIECTEGYRSHRNGYEQSTEPFKFKVPVQKTRWRIFSSGLGIKRLSL